MGRHARASYWWTTSVLHAAASVLAKRLGAHHLRRWYVAVCDSCPRDGMLVVGLDARSPLRGSKLAHGLEACLKGIVLIYQLENSPLHDACSFERN